MEKTTQGFSLIEMLVVMMIIAVLSSSGIYGLQQWQQYYHLWQTTHQLGQFLHHLRSDANVLNRHHILTYWQLQDRWCLTSQWHEGKPCLTKSQWQFIPHHKDIAMREITHGLGFYGVMNTAKPGHIILNNASGQRKIIVSSWGRIRSCSVQNDAICK